MAFKSNLKRGFKTRAEEMAIEYREKLGLFAWSPLDAFHLADHLGIRIYSAAEILSGSSTIKSLSEECGWSALTMTTKANNTIIIHNPYHLPARQQSNIMHEIAHFLCEHTLPPSRSVPLPLGMRQFDPAQEEEAICLGAAMQIAKPGLLWALKRNMSIDMMASHFNASHEMVKYRLHLTGAERQAYFSRLKRSKA
ncbi:hypothetical protein BWI96_10590 [Siphonobacter sp. SORGH_AS_0500]|uniref:ImmA/IrrE family metallo-endopeptidase n=1 Tax=Siphonobacter sp. SORGH_AS_0500 TaxID=1864824 RepID=UPI000CB50638|nr:ImmA/IrrE family metallo-endopeptidase [Siphonobacter sp. SORGH_AS_0500]PKK36809.1 hypothetical protein BWI96_10590 [Siphonobacter sp. SORGH_AS_0500]